jgi:hypothetical protein
MIAVGGAGLVVVTPSFAFLFSAVVSGMLFGAADSLHFLDKKWPRSIALGVLVMLATVARDWCLPKLGPGKSALVLFQFLALAFLVGMIVVQLGVRAEDRAKVG